MTNQLPFKLFSCVLPVRGARRCALVDVQRHVFRLIPEGLFEILRDMDGFSIPEVKAAFQGEHDALIDEYFEWLEREELVFFTETPELFPPIDWRWNAPAEITNAILDLDQDSDPDFPALFEELGALGCKYVQIRCFCEKDLPFWEHVLAAAHRSRVTSIEIVTRYHPGFDKKHLFDFCQRFPRVILFTAHTAPATEQVYGARTGIGHIFFTEQALDSSAHCGVILPDFFTVNIKNVSEALHHNSCLNRKISIDTIGNIKNCPSMPQSYGNIRTTTLHTALEHPDFRKFWHLNKDQVAVCRDCEFRYICTDCRAYLEQPHDPASKPLKCGYDPYTCQWEEWSTNPLKHQAMEHYGLSSTQPTPKPADYAIVDTTC